MLSKEIYHRKIAGGKVNNGRADIFNNKSLVAAVFKASALCNNVTVVECSINESELAPRNLIGHGDLKRVRLVFTVYVRGGKPRKGRLSFVDPVRRVTEIRSSIALGASYANIRAAVVARTKRGVFQRICVKGKVGGASVFVGLKDAVRVEYT